MPNLIKPILTAGQYMPSTSTTGMAASASIIYTLSYDAASTSNTVSWSLSPANQGYKLQVTTLPALDYITIDNSMYQTFDWAGLDAVVGQRIRKRKRLEPPLIRNHRGDLARAAKCPSPFGMVSPEELVALRLLRSMVSPEAFRRYLKHQLVTVTGPSGLQYDIHRTERICVRLGAQYLATLCVHLSRSAHCPPTDEVVAKMLMAELDEPDLWRRSNHRLAPGLNVANIQPLRDLRIAA